MNKVKDALERAWKRIEDPSNRCTRNYAIDKNGIPVSVKSASAVRFCSVGALESVCDDYKVCFHATTLLGNAAWELLLGSVPFANDSDVINNPPKIYARAIEMASKEDGT